MQPAALSPASPSQLPKAAPARAAAPGAGPDPLLERLPAISALFFGYVFTIGIEYSGLSIQIPQLGASKVPTIVPAGGRSGPAPGAAPGDLPAVLRVRLHDRDRVQRAEHPDPAAGRLEDPDDRRLRAVLHGAGQGGHRGLRQLPADEDAARVRDL